MNKSNIEWTDFTWNPVSGCDKVSPGCKFCYAEAVSRRWGRPFLGEVILNHHKLMEPLRKKKHGRCFVNSMSDLFHKDVPFDFIDQVFAIMVLQWRIDFQILTKRAERMAEYFSAGREELVDRWAEATYTMALSDEKDDSDAPSCSVNNMCLAEWPRKNIWLGVSCEDQKHANERIPLLMKVPSAVRFVSAEPLLGPINFQAVPVKSGEYEEIHWVIVGGESGPKARPMHPDWARRIREQCQRTKVPFFFKQWGQWAPINRDFLLRDPEQWKAVYRDGFQSNTHLVREGEYPAIMLKSNKHENGHVLDGQIHQAFPNPKLAKQYELHL